MHQNLIDPDDGPRPKYSSGTIVSLIAIECRAWVEAKKDLKYAVSLPINTRPIST